MAIMEYSVDVKDISRVATRKFAINLEEEKKMAKAVFQLEPLTCPSCIKKIETTLTKTTGVDLVKVLFQSSKVKVDFNEAQLTPQQIETTITKLGYSVLSAKVS